MHNTSAAASCYMWNDHPAEGRRGCCFKQRISYWMCLVIVKGEGWRTKDRLERLPCSIRRLFGSRLGYDDVCTDVSHLTSPRLLKRLESFIFTPCSV